MKKTINILLTFLVLVSCKDKGKKAEVILPRSVGSINTVLTVLRTDLWEGKLGDQVRVVFGEHQVGLPQPETILSMSQVDPEGFTKIMNNNRSVMVVSIGKEEGVKILHDKYARPQTIVSVTAKDESALINLIKKRGKEIIKIFKDQDIKFTQNRFSVKKLDEKKFPTIKKLNLSLTIPEDYRFVKDSLGFLWLRQHLKSGIARGDGTNNILLYSLPLTKDYAIQDSITKIRDAMGQKHIPGAEQGMYMITEQAYTPFTYETQIDGRKAYETRGKWEVKNDFMAGPFLNYTILDEKNNRVVVVEGFTYAPSINKRDFMFELEAIAKSLKFE